MPKTIVITGGTNGIGLAAAEALAAHGEHVVIVGRSETRARMAAARAGAAAAGGATVGTLVANLSSQAGVRRLAQEIRERCPALDVLVNNAGAMYTTRQLNADGTELTWGLNHLAPFLLTTLLLDHLKARPAARIITTASDAHLGARIPFDDLNAERSYGGFGRYKQSKLANILFTRELARRLQGSDTAAYCFHPGLVATGFNRNNGVLVALATGLLMTVARTPERGAETLVWLATAPGHALVNGAYYVDKEPRRPSPEAEDMQAARRLWEVSETQCRERAAPEKAER
jgi:NAD(P)-dependent dehydrogenase (short-subunit alcohol dehydrogenase family)